MVAAAPAAPVLPARPAAAQASALLSVHPQSNAQHQPAARSYGMAARMSIADLALSEGAKYIYFLSYLLFSDIP
jgi:hypothetical protein